MITASLIALPFIAAVILLLLPGNLSKWAALAATLLQAIFTGYVIVLFNINEHNSLLANAQFIIDQPWITTIGIRFFAAIDGISMLMLILTNFLLPLIVLSTWDRPINNSKLFYFLVLMMQGALVGVFVSLDGFLYYVFWELALIPIYFIVLLWGGENRVKITFKFFIYTLFGSLFMLAAIIWLYLQTGDLRSFGIDAFYNLNLSLVQQRWVFWAFFLAYAIKIPLLPFHTWQPDTYNTAPNAGTMLLSAIMLKMGIYSIMRWLLPIAPAAVMAYSDLVIILCIVGIIYASWIAIGQKEIKRLFAWSSIAHVALITAGVFTLSRTGFQGALVQMLSHGVCAVGMFFVAEIFMRRRGTYTFDKLGGVRQQAPIFASAFLVIAFGSAALPLTSGFIGEFLLLNSLYEYNFWYATFAGLTIILGAVYMLRAFKFSMLGAAEEGSVFQDLTTSEKLVFFPIVGLIIFLGVFPQFIFNLTDESVKYLITEINQHLATEL